MHLHLATQLLLQVRRYHREGKILKHIASALSEWHCASSSAYYSFIWKYLLNNSTNKYLHYTDNIQTVLYIVASWPF
jgi:hypothetical protein